MKVAFEASFARDLKRVRDQQLLHRVRQAIESIKSAPDMGSVSSLKKIQGHETFYRIRLGDYRLGIEVMGEEVIFVRLLHRKDIYRYFP